MKKLKRNAIFFKLSWYKVFVYKKLKLFNFLVDSVLSVFTRTLPKNALPNPLSEYVSLNNVFS